jgi:hypothetical protein
MRALGRVVVAAAVMLLVVVPAMAQEPYQQESERRPDLGLAAAVGNLVFFPVRLGITTVGGVLGGFTGFMTAGNQEAAEDVWDLFQGQNVLTPEIVGGKEALRFGYLEFTATGPPH